MSWFQNTNLASFAKTALKEAQKTIDKALDINEEGNNGDGVGRSSTAAVAVTDMASEFFASWGVGAGGSSSSSSNINSNSTDKVLVNATVVDSSDNAISTPPIRTATSIFGGDDNEQTKNGTLTVTSAVTLVASSTFDEDTNLNDSYSKSTTNSQNHVVEFVSSSSSSGGSKHTRSLSDTVFHAIDDTNSDLVQVLDDTSATSFDGDNRVSFLSNESYCDPSSSSVSFNNGNNIHSPPTTATAQDANTNREEEGVQLVGSNLINFSEEQSADRGNHQETIPSNRGLLQEINLDLDGCSGEVDDDDGLGKVSTFASTSSAEVVESTTLSDGWDWTSASDSCLAIVGNVETNKGDGGVVNDEQDDVVVDDMEDEPCDTAPKTEPESTFSSSGEPSSTTANFYKTADAKKIEKAVDVDSVEEATAFNLSPISSENNEQVSSSFSSRPTSPHKEHDEGEESEVTPLSSARVSPNFEIVSSSGAPQPESSRSSSIVVVSGRDSTPNSRDTSGAGSSGSSEVDIADDGEIQSPATTNNNAASPTLGNSFRSVSKHKKGASSSSSDIEVIQAEYANAQAF